MTAIKVHILRSDPYLRRTTPQQVPASSKAGIATKTATAAQIPSLSKCQEGIHYSTKAHQRAPAQDSKVESKSQRPSIRQAAKGAPQHFTPQPHWKLKTGAPYLARASANVCFQEHPASKVDALSCTSRRITSGALGFSSPHTLLRPGSGGGPCQACCGVMLECES